MPLKIAHRGASGTHPENTMAAFRRALELGADAIEFDVQRTSDGELVVIHDQTADRTTTASGLIMLLTAVALRTAEAGAWKDPSFAGERVPTLTEVIRGVPQPCRLFLEIKAGSLHYPGIEEQVLAVLRAEGALGRTQVSSFDHHALHRLHQLEPELSLAVLLYENAIDPVGIARSCGATAIHPYFAWATPGLIQTAHAAGMEVHTWTVNEPMLIELVKQTGVDGIMSDYPDRL